MPLALHCTPFVFEQRVSGVARHLHARAPILRKLSLELRKMIRLAGSKTEVSKCIVEYYFLKGFWVEANLFQSIFQGPAAFIKLIPRLQIGALLGTWLVLVHHHRESSYELVLDMHKQTSG